MATPGFLINIKKYTTDLLKYSSKKTPAKPIVLILFVYALEQILTTKTFYSCPESGHRAYGALFLFGPGLCFFVLSLLLNKSFLNTVSGCWKRRNMSQVCWSTIKALKTGIFVAFVWLVLAFANTQFYLCFSLGPEPSKDRLDKMDEKKRKEKLMLFSNEKTRSTVICWSLFLSAICFAFFSTMIRTCIFSEAEGTLPSLQKYEKLERKAVAAKFKEKMEMLAKEEGEKQVEKCLKDAQREGKTMSAVIREAKESLEKKYGARRAGGSTQDIPLDHMTENEQANGHLLQHVTST